LRSKINLSVRIWRRRGGGIILSKEKFYFYNLREVKGVYPSLPHKRGRGRAYRKSCQGKSKI
jgi:hypothetical protein